jgi:hypothetical protein
VEQGQALSSADLEAVSRLATEVLARPVRRKSFAADPLGTLKAAGIDEQALPGRLLDTLADLSDEELRIVGKVAQSLVDSKIPTGKSGLIF